MGTSASARACPLQAKDFRETLRAVSYVRPDFCFSAAISLQPQRFNLQGNVCELVDLCDVIVDRIYQSRTLV